MLRAVSTHTFQRGVVYHLADTGRVRSILKQVTVPPCFRCAPRSVSEGSGGECLGVTGMGVYLIPFPQNAATVIDGVPDLLVLETETTACLPRLAMDSKSCPGRLVLGTGLSTSVRGKGNN